MSAGKAGVPLDVCCQQIVAGDPYWHGPRGHALQNEVLLQIAGEWREMLDEKTDRLQKKMMFEDECG